MAAKRAPSAPMKSVSTALRLFLEFARERQRFSVGELAESTGLSKSHVSKVLAAFVESGLLLQDRDIREFSVGARAFVLGARYANYDPLSLRMGCPVYPFGGVRHNRVASGGRPLTGAPAGTPRDIILKLAAEVAATVKVAEVAEVAEQIRKGSGSDPVGSSPEELIHNFESEVKLWTEAARLANFQPQ